MLLLHNEIFLIHLLHYRYKLGLHNFTQGTKSVQAGCKLEKSFREKFYKPLHTWPAAALAVFVRLLIQERSQFVTYAPANDSEKEAGLCVETVMDEGR